MTSFRRARFVVLVTAAGAFLAGCAGDNGLLSTGALQSADAVATPAAAPKVDPACVTLASQIDTLRKEGTVGRLEAAAAGKSATVPVLRASLQKQAALNKVNADFQARCSKIPMAPQAAQAPAQPASAVVAAAAAPAMVKAVAKATPASGVTSVTAAAPVVAAAKSMVPAVTPAVAPAQ